MTVKREVSGCFLLAALFIFAPGFGWMIVCVLALGCLAPYTRAQEIVPSMEWERLYTNSACYFNSVGQTSDRGYIFGGRIYDVAQEADLVGAILLKVGSQGEVQWEKIYGGGGIRSVGQTTDGCYIFAGTASQFGLGDAWVVKVDGEGNKLWEQVFGGTEGDSIASMWPTTDGGYIFAGDSGSPPSGNKEAPLLGIADGWLIKIDAQGNKQWERSFGGENNDAFTSVRQTSDGGYVLAGRSFSPPSGNKESPNYGSEDAWLVKVDAQGNKQWEKSFGGTEDEIFRSLDQTTDGGIILGGTSSSPASGNKESPQIGGFDYWLVKVDVAGNKQWDRSYGTRTGSIEEVRVVRQTTDQGYVFGGSFGGRSRLVKVDAQGHEQWDELLGEPDGPNNSYIVEINDLQQTKDGGYVLGGRFDLPNAGPPPSGCTWGSWAAKVENVVSRTGNVVAWKTQAGLVLESVSDLNTDWRNDQSEVLSLGAASAVALVPAGQQRYYRLRATGTPNDPPSLSFGALLSWPLSANQTLEFSSSKDGPWTSFPGDQGSIGDTRYAIVPQNLKQHYFRTRTID